MKIIGLSGGSGSGKGTVARLMLKAGIPTIDTDAVYHSLTAGKSECLDALCSEFGDGIISPSGALDRAALAKIVFCGPDADLKRAALNKIAHKYVLDETRMMLSDYEHSGAPAVTVDAPLLFESGFDAECDKIIAVLADEKIRIGRIVERDRISAEQARMRIKSQLTDEFLRSKADYVIVNNGDVADLASCVSDVVKDILKD